MVHPVSTSGIAKTRAVAASKAEVGQPLADVSVPAISVSPSLLSRMVHDLTEQGPPVDFAKIAQLRQAIATGRYHVDPRSVARAMIGFGT